MNGNQMFAIGISMIGFSITCLIYELILEPGHVINELDALLGIVFIAGLAICYLAPVKLFHTHYTSRNGEKDESS